MLKHHVIMYKGNLLDACLPFRHYNKRKRICGVKSTYSICKMYIKEGCLKFKP